MISLQQYVADPDAATEQIRAQVSENLGQQGIPANSKAGLVDMLVRFAVVDLELARLHHRLLNLEVQS